MWVTDIPETQQRQQSSWQLNPFASKPVKPPVEVEVHWYDGWSMSHLQANKTARQVQQKVLKAHRVSQ